MTQILYGDRVSKGAELRVGSCAVIFDEKRVKRFCSPNAPITVYGVCPAAKWNWVKRLKSAVSAR